VSPNNEVTQRKNKNSSINQNGPIHALNRRMRSGREEDEDEDEEEESDGEEIDQETKPAKIEAAREEWLATDAEERNT
jgi:hypothetical protein